MNINIVSKNNKCSNIVALFLFVLLSCSLSAQNTAVISGLVTDTNKQPLPGASVVNKKNNTGTVTGINGQFKINVPPNVEVTLLVSFVGYTPQTIKAKSGATISVALAEDATTMENVVVVGYGNMRKSDITGAVTSVNVNDVEAASSASIQSLLQGRAAGVQVTTGDAAPGAAVNIKIRGTGSLTGGSEPLYVVDGLIMNSTGLDSKGPELGQIQQAQNGLTGINPQDIESMEILKDASATAIYGSLGANGVILITTKRGKSATPKVEYVGSASYSVMANKREVLSLDEYIEYRNLPGKSPLTGLETKKAIDWQDDVTRNSYGQSHRITISRNANGNNLYIGGGIMNNQGVVKNSGLSQGDFRFNMQQQVAKSVKFGTNNAFTYLKNSMVVGSDSRAAISNSGLIRSMVSYQPYIDYAQTVDPDTQLSFDEGLVGPRAWLEDYADKSKEYRILSSLYLDIKLRPWLSMRTTAAVDYRNKNRNIWFGERTWAGKDKGGQASVSLLRALRYNVDHMFNFNFKKNRHRIDGTVGGTLTYSSVDSNPIFASSFEGNVDYREEGLMYGNTFLVPDYGRQTTKSLSALARIVYNYDERYILTTTFRADGTSKFAPGNKFSYFPSMALAYRVSQEQFMNNIESISNLKLRLGWGMVGNQGVSPYQTLNIYGSTSYSDPTGNGYVIGTILSALSNPNLIWETTSQYNAGVDLGMFNNRLNLTVDIYQKTSKNLLQQIEIPLNAGFSKMWINRGSIQNKGLEIILGVVPYSKRNLTIAINGNISFNRNKITDIGLPKAQFGAHYWSAMLGSDVGYGSIFKMPSNIFIEGYPVAMFYGLKVDGLVQSKDVESDRNIRMQNYLAVHPGTDPSAVTDTHLVSVDGILPTFAGKMLVAGDPKYVDMDKNGKVEIEKDKTIIGNPNPDFTYGFSLDVTYKGFFMNAVFTGVQGRDIANGNFMLENPIAAGQGSNTGNITRRVYQRMWTEENPNAQYPRFLYNGEQGTFTSMIIEDGSYLRFSTLTLGYRWSFKKKAGISSLGVSVTGRNLFCLTKYTGYDPEVNSFSYDWSRVGVDWGSYPNTRTITLGVNIGF